MNALAFGTPVHPDNIISITSCFAFVSFVEEFISWVWKIPIEKLFVYTHTHTHIYKQNGNKKNLTKWPVK